MDAKPLVECFLQVTYPCHVGDTDKRSGLSFVPRQNVPLKQQPGKESVGIRSGAKFSTSYEFGVLENGLHARLRALDICFDVERGAGVLRMPGLLLKDECDRVDSVQICYAASSQLLIQGGDFRRIVSIDL